MDENLVYDEVQTTLMPSVNVWRDSVASSIDNDGSESHNDDVS